jgi:hypothetical protein
MKKQINPTIKAHLIRGAFYLLILACAIPLALAQRNATNRSVATATANPNVTFDPAAAPPAAAEKFPTVSSGSTGVAPLEIPPYPQAPQVVLYDQYDNASTVATLSDTFTDFPAFSSDLADDFVVPTDQTWNVQSIDADGVYFSGSGPANSFNVFFYANDAGLPGTQVYSAMNQPFSVVGSTFTVNLPSIAVLSAGTYWVEIQANMTLIPNGEWDWRDRILQSNQGAAWQNPGGGFGACPTWTRKPTCIPSTGGPDQVFRLNGTIQETSPTPSPSASPTATGTPTATPTATATATPTSTPTATASPTVTATATATPTSTPVGCVFGQGFWKNHPDQWPVTQLQLGNVTYTEDQLLSILHQPVRGNGLVLLAHQEIAAKLNIANGADESCIQQTLAAADTLIGNLVVPPVGNGFLRPRDVSALADTLEEYNEGMLCAASCEGSPPPTATPAARSRPTVAPRPH